MVAFPGPTVVAEVFVLLPPVTVDALDMLVVVDKVVGADFWSATDDIFKPEMVLAVVRLVGMSELESWEIRRVVVRMVGASVVVVFVDVVGSKGRKQLGADVVVLMTDVVPRMVSKFTLW